MKLWLVALFACVSVSAFAQTPPIDDCPAGHQLHHSITALDDASLIAAARASFVGLFHREPTMRPGAGSDDIMQWVRYSNHYGLYGDDVCRAGWNLYRERQLGGLQTGPADGDLPAQFLPSVAPPHVDPPPPLPPLPQIPSLDLSSVSAKLDELIAVEIAHANRDEQHWQNVKSAWEAYGIPFAKYVMPILATYLTCHQIGKC